MDEKELIDQILATGNKSYTGFDIRQRLAEAGFQIVPTRVTSMEQVRERMDGCMEYMANYFDSKESKG